MRFTLHHIGIAVPDIEEASAKYVQRYGYEIKSPIIEDRVQTARVRFLKLPSDSSYLELVTPTGPNSKVQGALSSGRRLNHVCYVVEDIARACSDLREAGLFLLQEPVEAAAFRPRRIAWLMDRDGIPIELVEPGAETWPGA